MFEKAQIRRSREKMEVTMRLANGDTLDGHVFVASDERVSDLLNDERAFLPVETLTETVMVAKTQIAEVRTIAAVETNESGDPYEILRIERHASDEELRSAWMGRVKRCHPDRLAALEMDEEIVQAARRACQRINAAYDQAIRERKAARAA